MNKKILQILQILNFAAGNFYGQRNKKDIEINVSIFIIRREV